MEKLYKQPALIAGIIFAVTVVLGLQLPKVELDNNNIRFLPAGNQAKITADYIDETFGGQVMIFVGLERPYRSIFEKNFLTKVKKFSNEIENFSIVKSVNSIMSTQYIYGEGDTIIVSELVPDDFSGTPEEIAELKRRIASWDLYQGSLVSEDHSSTQMLITLNVKTEDNARPEVTKFLTEIRQLAKEIFTDDAKLYFSGLPILNATVNESIIADNVLLIPLVVVVVLTVLFLSFRRLIFVVLPISTVLIAVIWTIGLTGLLELKLSIITTILPVILVAIGHAYGVHILTHYVKEFRDKELSLEEHRQLVFDLMRKMIKPIFIAAITTMTGFISFCFTPIVPMQEFGFSASVGVAAVFIVAIFFIPSMLLLRGPKNIKQMAAHHKVNRTNDRFSSVVASIFLAIARRKYLVLFLSVLVIFISIFGISRIVVDNSVVDFFKNETDISKSDRFISEHFGGSKELNLVIQADTTEELLHPDVLLAIDSLSDYLTNHVPLVGKVVGYTDVIKRVNQVVNADQNPDGLAQREPQSGGFGFNNDNFGFGNFGFDDDDHIGSVAVSDTSPHDINQYSTADIITFLDSASGVSQQMNSGDLVRELKRLTNYEGMAYYEIPSQPERYGKRTSEELQKLIANYLVLLAGGDDSGYSNDPLEPTALRMFIQLKTTGSSDTYGVMNIINEYIALNFPGYVRTMIGGGVTQEIAVTDLILHSQIISIFISVFMIFIIVAISHKSFVAGFIGTIPLILAVLCNFIVMGFLGIKLNLGTALIASLTVSIAIDDAIHFLEFFKRETKAAEHGSLRRTFLACGKAICITALSVGAGFGVLGFSQFKIIAELGILIGLCMLSTTVVSLTVIPALIMVIKPRFIYNQEKPKEIS